VRNLILQVIDFFYPLFRKLMPLQTFRYAACGGFNTVLDIILFHCLQLHFDNEVVYAGVFAMSPHIAAFIGAFIITFPLGFYFSRYVVFTGSNIRGRIQLFRYFLLVLACIALNYMFLKVLVEQLKIYPTVSKVLTTIVVVSFSYFTQKHFTFKIRKIEISRHDLKS
jgi:putative flippase GtrA